MKKTLLLRMLCLALLLLALPVFSGCAKNPAEVFWGSWEVAGYEYILVINEDGTADVTNAKGAVLVSGFYSVEDRNITVDMGDGFISVGILGNDIITFTSEDVTTEYRRIPEAADKPAMATPTE